MIPIQAIMLPMPREYLPFEEAREFVRGLDLKSQSEWRKFCKGEMPEKGSLPVDIPSKPAVYGEGIIEGECTIPGNFLNDGSYTFTLHFAKDTW